MPSSVASAAANSSRRWARCASRSDVDGDADDVADGDGVGSWASATAGTAMPRASTPAAAEPTRSAFRGTDFIMRLLHICLANRWRYHDDGADWRNALENLSGGCADW